MNSSIDLFAETTIDRASLNLADLPQKSVPRRAARPQCARQPPAPSSSEPQASQSRYSAVLALCDHLSSHSSSSAPFYLHPSLAFEEAADGEVCVRARRRLGRDDIVLAVPQRASIYAAHPLVQTVVLTTEGERLDRILAEVAKRFDAWAGGMEHRHGESCVLADLDCPLVALVMFLLTATHARDEEPAELTCWRLVAATWPSAAQLRHLPLYWHPTALAELRGTVAGQRVEMLRTEAADLFEAVMHRALGGATRAAHFSGGGGLRATFVHAISLVLSRGLEADYGRVGADLAETDADEGAERTPNVVPAVVELFNGLPEGDDSIGCNIELFTGRPFESDRLKPRWPWPGGDAPPSQPFEGAVVQALGDVAAGDELLFSYGDVPTCDFLLKFGHVPRQLLPLDLPNDAVCIRLAASMLPPSSDAMRWQALRAAGYMGPTREADDGEPIVQTYELCTADLTQYVSSAAEPMALSALRSFVLLLRAPSALLASRDFRRIQADSGARRAVGVGLVEVIEWNLAQLATASSTTDLEALFGSSTAVAPSMAAIISARIKERELLLRWRYAISGAFGLTVPTRWRGFWTCPGCGRELRRESMQTRAERDGGWGITAWEAAAVASPPARRCGWCPDG